MTVRPATRSDTTALVACWEQLMADGARVDPALTPPLDGAQRFRARILDLWFGSFLPFPAAWVAEREGQVIGLISGLPHPTHALRVHAPTARIEDLWVHPEHRRQGIATQLLAAFEAAARDAGYPRVEVGTLAADERAVAFWKSSDYVAQTLFLQKR